MLKVINDLFRKNIALKIISLLLALIAWFYIVKELGKGSDDDRQFLRRILPEEQLMAKRLSIRPLLVGKARKGYDVVKDKIIIMPDMCIAVGKKELLGGVRYAFTIPIDISGADKTVEKSIALSPISPGVYMEETLVQITIPIERSGG